jgi:AraC-like DNA-binding protein
MPAGVAYDLDGNAGFGWHQHDQHQLALAGKGVLSMSVADTTWVLPPSRALWVPAGIRHSVATTGTTTMLSLYLEPADCPIGWSAPTVVRADGLVGQGERARAEAVLCDVLEPLPVATLPTPMPSDERARRVAEALKADPSDDRSLGAWGNEVGASARTLARLFTAETGIGFERWRTHARLAAALPLLADGASIANVAHQVGYATPSALVAAFKREIGVTPTAYFGR